MPGSGAASSTRSASPTLIAARGEENGMPTYTFDIHLQGEKETVFFDI